MDEIKPITFDGAFIDKYWDGPSNFLARQYAYLQRGFGIVNEAKNYFLIIFGSFWTAKAITIMGYSIDPRWTLVAGAIGLPTLIFVGRWQLFKAQKAIEVVSARHGSVTGYNGYNMQIEQTQLLRDIKQLLINGR